MATDEAIEQRLGEAPEDEAVKERLEREHGELLEELRALIPGAQVLFGFLLAIRLAVHRPEHGPALCLLRYPPDHGGRARLSARPLRLPPPALPRGDKDAMVRKGNRKRLPGPAPSPWPSRACCTSSPTWSLPPKPRSRSRWSSSR